MKKKNAQICLDPNVIVCEEDGDDPSFPWTVKDWKKKSNFKLMENTLFHF